MANDGKPKHNYTYVGKSTNPEDHEFNQSKYNQMVDDRDYEGAYDYAMQFRLNDPLEEDERMNDLKNMLREGHITQTVYRNIDESAYPAVDFRNNVMQPGGLERLEADNIYANKFKELKNGLGGGASRLQVVFDPKKRKGLFGLDFIAVDNDDANIDVFYEKSGLNKQYLESNGVTVRLKDGYTYLEFDKSNDLANTILLNLPHDSDFSPWIWGLDENGNRVKDTDYLVKVGVGDAGIGSYTSTFGMQRAREMQNLYKAAQKVENTAYELGTAKVKQYSSQIFPLIYENAENLEAQLAAGQIKPSDFNTRIKRENKKLIDGIAFINPADYEIQSAWFNDDDSPVNVELDQEQKDELMERYRGTQEKNIRYGIVIAGGRAGITIQLPPETDNNGKVKKESCSFTIFGDDIEQQLQRQINNDPGMQAYQEVNDMQDLGYTYKDNNGNSYTYDGLGGWIVNGNDKSKSTEWVRRQIHKDKAAQDVGRAIVMSNISVDGHLVNTKRYSNQVMAASFMIANDANKNGDIIEVLKDIYGDKIDYTDANAIAAAIFALKGTGNVVADEYRNKIANPVTYEKFNDIYEICANILNVGNRYIRSINEQ